MTFVWFVNVDNIDIICANFKTGYHFVIFKYAFLIK